MGISTDITITPGQTVGVSGDGALEWAPRWGSGGFGIHARGSLSLTYIRLDPLASITLNSDKGSLSMALMAVSVSMLGALTREVGGAGSTLRFTDVTVQEYHYGTAQTMAITTSDDGARTQEGSLSFGRPVFTVTSGRSCTDWHIATILNNYNHSCREWGPPPCEMSQGGRCVGRAHGYGGDEECMISVSGGGGTLAACSVFDIDVDATGGAFTDYVTLPGVPHAALDCPEGVSLVSGHTLEWHSDGFGQGNNLGEGGLNANGCDTKGTCGLPFTGPPPGPLTWGPSGLGGGWEVCFVPPVPGCTNPTASNYNPAATVEDGSCTSATPFRVGVKWETWEEIGGARLDLLTSSPAY